MADPDNTVLENARKRARRRLVGAVVLALATAVILPMFLESDPKPLGPDVQIQIPAIDDAKFQNRLTPAGTAAAPAAGKSAPPASPEPIKPAAETPPAAPAKAVVADAAGGKSEPAAPATGPAQKTAEGKPAPAAPAAKAVEPAGVPPVAGANDAQASAKQPAKPASPPAATVATPAKKAANPAPAAASAGQSNGPAPGQTAAPTPPAPAATLPAFSLTATVTAPAANAGAVPAAAPPAPASGAGQYVVQIGAFLDATVAKDLAAKAGQLGFTAFLEAVTTKSGQVQRVRIGPFATRGEADAAAAKLKGAGFTADARPR